MLEQLGELLREHEPWISLVAAGSALLLVASVALLPLFVGLLPADHFVRRRPLTESPHPLARVLRNGIGAVLVLAGLLMLVLPGQGLLTVIAGLTLLEFPGKRALEIRLARRPRVLLALNWLRRRAGKGPFEPPEPDGPEPDGPEPDGPESDGAQSGSRARGRREPEPPDPDAR